MNNTFLTSKRGFTVVSFVLILGILFIVAIPILCSLVESKQDYVFDKEDGYLRRINKPVIEGNMLIIPDEIDGVFVEDVYLGDIEECDAVYIPEHVKEVHGTYSIKKFVVDDNNRYLTTYRDSLYSKDLKTLIDFVTPEDNIAEFPKELKKVDCGLYLDKVDKIVFNCPVNQISFYDSYGKIFTKTKEVVFAEDENDFFEENHMIYRDNYKELVSSLGSLNEKEIIIRDDVEIIDDDAFYGQNIESLDTKNVKEIGEGAFNFCTKLRTIVLGDDIETIKKYTFANCRKIEGILFPKNLKYIDEYAFESSGVKNLELPEGLLEIGDYAFFECDIETLYFPSTIRIIGKEAFFDYDNGRNSKLTKVRLPQGTIVGENAFPKQVVVEFE